MVKKKTVAKKPASTKTVKKASKQTPKHTPKKTSKADVRENLFTIGMVLFLVALLAVIGIVVFSDFNKAGNEAEVIAYVNGIPVTTNDLFEVGLSAQQIDPAADPHVILNQTILIVLLRDEAQRQGIVVDTALVESRFAEKQELIQQQVSQEDFSDILSQMGITEEQFYAMERRAIYDDLLIGELLQSAVFDQVEDISDEDALVFYDQNPNLFVQPEQRWIQHILICFQGAQSCDKTMTQEEARIAAEQYRAQIVANPDLFEEIALEHSTDPSGFDLDYLPKGYLVEAFEQAAFSMNVGQISQLVLTEFGYHIIRVLDIAPAHLASFEDMKDMIKQELMYEKVANAQRTYLMDLFDAADVVIVE